MADERPSLVACKTIIGKGAPNQQGTSATHGAALGEDEVAAARETWAGAARHSRFPTTSWPLARDRRAAARRAEKWRSALRASAQGPNSGAAWPASCQASRLADYKSQALLAADPKKVATRKASEMALEVLTAWCPRLIGGSADLTGSNNTKTARPTA